MPFHSSSGLNSRSHSQVSSVLHLSSDSLERAHRVQVPALSAAERYLSYLGLQLLLVPIEPILWCMYWLKSSYSFFETMVSWLMLAVFTYAASSSCLNGDLFLRYPSNFSTETSREVAGRLDFTKTSYQSWLIFSGIVIKLQTLFSNLHILSGEHWA